MANGVAAEKAGVLVVDKPAGISSFKVVSRIRRITGIKKVGHAGTLDPFATGLLVVCIGRPATRLISSFMEGRKEYQATLCLGVTTETQDPEGKVLSKNRVEDIGVEQVESCLKRFRGKIMQTPPAYSALKHKGKPLYYYARRGIAIEKEAREVEIFTLTRLCPEKILAGEEVALRLGVQCSKGTYIRTLAEEIGQCLGCGAYLKELRRLASGSFQVESALGWQELIADDAEKHLEKHLLGLEEVAKLLQ